VSSYKDFKETLKKAGFSALSNPTVNALIVIDRKGKLLITKKTKSSGNEAFDNFIMEDVIQYATPFPPMPKFLPTN